MIACIKYYELKSIDLHIDKIPIENIQIQYVDDMLTIH